MHTTEYAHAGNGVQIARRGMTSIEAAEFLHREFPEVPTWMCWRPMWLEALAPLEFLMDHPAAKQGQVGDWRWERLPSAYPVIFYYDYRAFDRTDKRHRWVGVLKITGREGAEFLLASFLNSSGTVGAFYLVSTTDVCLLDRFLEAVRAKKHKDERNGTISVQGFGGPNIELSPEEDEPLVLPVALRHDIEEQVFSFFEQAALYKQLGLRYRRGFLMAGPPGNGKTMAIRHLARLCCLRHNASAAVLNIRANTSESMIHNFFSYGAGNSPALLIMEDVDSLTRSRDICRSFLLAELDGLASREGILVLATTNNAELIDPALVHRPSRFDRVWHFPLPDEELRRIYLQWVLERGDESLLRRLVRETDGWSFAYLKELRTTTLIIGLSRANGEWEVGHLVKGLQLLSAQFQAGRKNHAVAPCAENLGFGR